MNLQKEVSLFKNGRNQAIRIPREFEIEGTKAIIRKEGNHLIIEPLIKGKLLSILANLKPIDESFPDIDSSLLSLDYIEL